ncbi:hypothetical protein [Parahaliea aestuarii]|uniref:DUF2798 domain-containing protein n=1 Tax=Parahaliea aestuarii TaxID=1852021 RepID=A0A5C9A1C0_9GAMM|nr:hypothetical protein [Parahaliea aestuarii]TXS93417.1 hypothetical protein FVW59_06175 [Parahaliea aestuarii]
MKVFKKKNSEYNKAERICTAIYSFMMFAIIGAVVRLFAGGTITLGGGETIGSQFLPYMISFGAGAAILGYIFPKALNIIMCLIPTPGINS